MRFKLIIEPVLTQLADALTNVSEEAYKQKSRLLNGSTIGGHTRHVIELFQCLLQGYDSGIVNYEHRKRDLIIETNKNYASDLLLEIANKIDLPNAKLLLEGFYNDESDNEICSVQTNYFRELIYNLEHCIHHMALIRVGINELCDFTLPTNFGVAPSTMQYKKLCAQ